MPFPTDNLKKVRNRRPFTRLVALILAPLLVVGPTGPSLAETSFRKVAVLDPPPNLPPAQVALWQTAIAKVRSNPRILLKDEETVRAILVEWVDKTAAKEAELLSEAMSLRGAVRLQIDRAWDHYYRFDFPASRQALAAAEPVLDDLPSTDIQAGLLFEILLLDGMVLRAMRDPDYRQSFQRAASLKPGAVLEPERYSPDVIGDFQEAKRTVQDGPKATVSVTVPSLGGTVLIDGRRAGDVPLSGFETFPGVHFVEVVHEGFRSPATRIELADWQSVNLSFDLTPKGPTDPPQAFFAQRVWAGDSRFFRELARRLNVDLVVLGSWDGRDMRVWLIDGEGMVNTEGMLWSGDSDKGREDLLSDMLRQPEDEWARDEPVMGISVNVPEAPEQEVETEDDRLEGRRRKWYLILGGALLLAVAAGAMKDEGGGTRLEVTW